MDPYFKTVIRGRMKDLISATNQGHIFERFMMSAFSETFASQPLSEWPHQPSISNMYPALVDKVEIVGWREPGLEQGTIHKMMAMGTFMDAHANHRSVLNDKPVPPFFFPKAKPSGPDLVFFIKIDDCRIVPVFVQIEAASRIFHIF